MKQIITPKQKNEHTILRQGMLLAPLAAFCTSVRTAAACCIAFAVITVLSVLLGALLPKRFPLSIRIVLYSVIAGLVYIPAAILNAQIFPDVAAGVYIPLLASGLYLTVERDAVFPKKGMLRALFRNLTAVCAAAFLLGAVREAAGLGTLNGHLLTEQPLLPFMQHAACGLILLTGILIAAEQIRISSEKERSHADFG